MPSSAKVRQTIIARMQSGQSPRPEDYFQLAQALAKEGDCENARFYYHEAFFAGYDSRSIAAQASANGLHDVAAYVFGSEQDKLDSQKQAAVEYAKGKDYEAARAQVERVFEQWQSDVAGWEGLDVSTGNPWLDFRLLSRSAQQTGNRSAKTKLWRKALQQLALLDDPDMIKEMASKAPPKLVREAGLKARSVEARKALLQACAEALPDTYLDLARLEFASATESERQRPKERGVQPAPSIKSMRLALEAAASDPRVDRDSLASVAAMLGPHALHVAQIVHKDAAERGRATRADPNSSADTARRFLILALLSGLPAKYSRGDVLQAEQHGAPKMSLGFAFEIADQPADAARCYAEVHTVDAALREAGCHIRIAQGKAGADEKAALKEANKALERAIELASQQRHEIARVLSFARDNGFSDFARDHGEIPRSKLHDKRRIAIEIVIDSHRALLAAAPGELSTARRMQKSAIANAIDLEVDPMPALLRDAVGHQGYSKLMSVDLEPGCGNYRELAKAAEVTAGNGLTYNYSLACRLYFASGDMYEARRVANNLQRRGIEVPFEDVWIVNQASMPANTRYDLQSGPAASNTESGLGAA